MKTPLSTALVVAGVLTAPCLPASASDNERIVLPVGLLECMDVDETMRRLSCFDQEMARLTSSSAPGSETATEDVTTARRSQVEIEGTEEPVQSSDQAERVQEADSELQRAETAATVLRITERPYGEMIIELDNGQVWVEKIPSSSFRIEVGDSITVRRGRFGGYRLIGHGNRSTEVTRVK